MEDETIHHNEGGIKLQLRDQIFSYENWSNLLHQIQFPQLHD